MPKTQRLITHTAGSYTMQVLVPQRSRFDNRAARRIKDKMIAAADKALYRQKNTHTARQNLTLLIAANVDKFTKKDWCLCTFTCSPDNIPKNRYEAAQQMRNYLDKLRKLYAREKDAGQLLGEKLHHIKVLQEGSTARTNYHWHILINIPARYRRELLRLWVYGAPAQQEIQRIKREPSGAVNCYAIANYLLHEADLNRATDQRLYTCSRGLKRPVKTSVLVDSETRLTLPAGCEVAPGGDLISTEITLNGFSYRYERISFICPPAQQSGKYTNNSSRGGRRHGRRGDTTPSTTAQQQRGLSAHRRN